MKNCVGKKIKKFINKISLFLVEKKDFFSELVWMMILLLVPITLSILNIIYISNVDEKIWNICLNISTASISIACVGMYFLDKKTYKEVGKWQIIVAIFGTTISFCALFYIYKNVSLFNEYLCLCLAIIVLIISLKLNSKNNKSIENIICNNEKLSKENDKLNFNIKKLREDINNIKTQKQAVVNKKIYNISGKGDE